MKENPLMKYSEQLAVEIEKMCKSLDNKKDNANTILQIRKSSSSVFANISEAQYPQSLPDMLSRFPLVCTYEEDGINPELVIYKKR